MARYIVSIRSPLTPEAAFEYMADLRNFAEWDPGVKHVSQATGSGGGADAVFDVAVASVGRTLTLRYVTKAFNPPQHVLIEAVSRMFTSIDRITVAAKDSGCVVTYDAELKLNGPLRFADVLLKPAFQRIGDRAASGLRRVLKGETVPSSPSPA
jgi:carbon monoxide dehydrogenase subunit G